MAGVICMDGKELGLKTVRESLLFFFFLPNYQN